jgi:hypothetical protein
MTTKNPTYSRAPTPHAEPKPAPLGGTTQQQQATEAAYRAEHLRTMTRNGVPADAALPKE